MRNSIFVSIFTFIVILGLIYREPNAWIDGRHESFPGYVIVGPNTGIYSGGIY